MRSTLARRQRRAGMARPLGGAARAASGAAAREASDAAQRRSGAARRYNTTRTFTLTTSPFDPLRRFDDGSSDFDDFPIVVTGCAALTVVEMSREENDDLDLSRLPKGGVDLIFSPIVII